MIKEDFLKLYPQFADVLQYMPTEFTYGITSDSETVIIKGRVTALCYVTNNMLLQVDPKLIAKNASRGILENLRYGLDKFEQKNLIPT